MKGYIKNCFKRSACTDRDFNMLRNVQQVVMLPLIERWPIWHFWKRDLSCSLQVNWYYL